MKLKSTLLGLLAAAIQFPVRAEAAVVMQPAASVPAAIVRQLSLNDCVSMALEKNLDLRIERYNPVLKVYGLSIARGLAYDPLLTGFAQHERERTTGLFDMASSNTIPAGLYDTDRFGAGFKGSLPWGMSYDLSSSLNQSRSDNWSYSTTATNFVNAPFRDSGGTVSITLAQPLLRNSWVDGNRLSIRLAKNNVKYSEQGLRKQLINTISAVENAYYELIYAQESVKVQEKSLQLAEQLFKENKKRVEVGVMAPLDEKQAEAEMAARRADLIAAQRALESSQNTLKRLITDDYAVWHQLRLQPAETLVAEKQFYNIQDSWGRGMTLRPDLIQSRIDLESAGIQLKYDRNQLFPQLDLFGTYKRLGNGTVLDDTISQFRHENDSAYIVGLQFSVPLGSVAARNRLKQSKITVEQAVLALKSSEQSAMVEIDEAIKEAQSSFERVQATREASQFAQAALDAEQKKLDNGKSTSFEVLRLQSDLTTARSKEIRALADYNEALTSLAQAEGTTLERRKIDMKVK